jgi:hypothetical protein
MNTEIVISAKEKYSPRNKQEAYCFQLYDDVRVLRQLALLQDKKAFNEHVNTMILRLNQSKIK